MAISINTQSEPEDKFPNVFLKVGFDPNIHQKTKHITHNDELEISHLETVIILP